MSTPSRLIQVSSDSPLIVYEPVDAWTGVPKTNSMFQNGVLGFPVSSFLETTTNGTIAFSFEGSSVEAEISFIPNDQEPIPIVNCMLDGNALTTTIPQLAENDWSLCGSRNLPAGEHTFMIEVQSHGASFFFDYLLYAPSSHPQHNDVSLRIDASDIYINYSGVFMSESDTGSARLTNASGAFINVSFTGQQLTWYGAYSTFLPFLPSSAEYSIDGGTFKQIFLSGLNSGPNTAPLLNQVLFQTEALSQGPHHLTARYLGDGHQTALSLVFLVIHNVTSESFSIIPSNTTDNASSSSTPSSSIASFGSTTSTNVTSSTLFASSSISTRTSQPTPDIPAKPHKDRDILIDIHPGVGVLILAVIVVVIYLYIRRSHRKRALEEKQNIKEQPDTAATSDRMSSAFYAEAPDPCLQRDRTMQTMKTATSDSLDGWMAPNSPSERRAALTLSTVNPTEALILQV